MGDIKEMEAVRAVFGERPPLISSTKSLTGHSLGAAGAQEAIYCLLMMQNGFVAESANIENLDPAFADMPIVRERQDTRSRDGDVQQLRLRRHQRLPGDGAGLRPVRARRDHLVPSLREGRAAAGGEGRVFGGSSGTSVTAL